MASTRSKVIEMDTAVQGKVVSQEDKDRRALLQALTALGSTAVGDDSIAYEGTRIVLPENLKGPNGLERAAKILLDHKRQLEQTFAFSRTFPFRPYDGAAAFERAMMRLFGTAGIGKSWRDMFGREHPPQLITVDVGWNETMQVPWDEVQFDLLEAQFDIGVTETESGFVSHISVQAPRKYRAMIEGFFRVIEDELRTNSIYQGKAINGAPDPGFWNEHEVDADRIVYNDATRDDLFANVWSAIKFADTMRKHNIPLKRAFLLAGSWGTGKTMAGALTAQQATSHGWTFILVRPEDDPLQAIKTAQLYSPAVVWIEDADNLASKNKTRATITKVLDVMDGIQAKGKEIIVGFTTNYPKMIERGMLRPGRIDSVIKVGAVEDNKIEPLIRAIINEPLLAPDINWSAVTAAFQEYVPAFAVEAAQRAVRYSIARNQGHPSVLTTEDLVKAAAGLRDQERMMNNADEAGDAPSVDSTIHEVVLGAAENALKRSSLAGHQLQMKDRETRTNGVAAH